jgi:predicted RNase H-like HicB family nuclease
MRLSLELEREEDGRWIAEVEGLPGVLAYGATQEEAARRAWSLALKVIGEKLAHGELSAPPNKSMELPLVPVPASA